MNDIDWTLYPIGLKEVCFFCVCVFSMSYFMLGCRVFFLTKTVGSESHNISQNIVWRGQQGIYFSVTSNFLGILLSLAM